MLTQTRQCHPQSQNGDPSLVKQPWHWWSLVNTTLAVPIPAFGEPVGGQGQHSMAGNSKAASQQHSHCPVPPSISPMLPGCPPRGTLGHPPPRATSHQCQGCHSPASKAGSRFTPLLPAAGGPREQGAAEDSVRAVAGCAGRQSDSVEASGDSSKAPEVPQLLQDTGHPLHPIPSSRLCPLLPPPQAHRAFGVSAATSGAQPPGPCLSPGAGGHQETFPERGDGES